MKIVGQINIWESIHIRTALFTNEFRWRPVKNCKNDLFILYAITPGLHNQFNHNPLSLFPIKFIYVKGINHSFFTLTPCKHRDMTTLSAVWLSRKHWNMTTLSDVWLPRNNWDNMTTLSDVWLPCKHWDNMTTLSDVWLSCEYWHNMAMLSDAWLPCKHWDNMTTISDVWLPRKH